MHQPTAHHLPRPLALCATLLLAAALAIGALSTNPTGGAAAIASTTQAPSPHPAPNSRPDPGALKPPTNITFTVRGGTGGWNMRWQAVPGATSYQVASPFTGFNRTVRGTSLVVPEPTELQRRQNLMLPVTITALGSHGRRSSTVTTRTTCSPAYIYASRGSGQSMGPGPQASALAATARKNLGGLSRTQLTLIFNPYAAVDANVAAANPFGTKYYFDSVDHGTDIATAFLKSFRSLCPYSRLVMFGYSQGADVVGTVAAGPGAATTARQTDHVSLLADPRRNEKDRAVNRPAGATRGGLLSDRPLFPNGVRQKTRSWCDKADDICHNNELPANHAGTAPDGYLVNCAAWSVEAALSNRIPGGRWNQRPLPSKCR